MILTSQVLSLYLLIGPPSSQLVSGQRGGPWGCEGTGGEHKNANAEFCGIVVICLGSFCFWFPILIIIHKMQSKDGLFT